MKAPHLRERDREGMIEPGMVSWFTQSDWLPHSFIWGKRDAVWISAVHARSPGHGALSRLFQHILNNGRKIVVPTPLHQMSIILAKKEFAGPYQKTYRGEVYELWIKDVPVDAKYKTPEKVDKTFSPQQHPPLLQRDGTGWQKSPFGVHRA